MRRAGRATLLGAACTAWSAIPLQGTGGLGVLLVVVAAICVGAGALRLLRKDSAPEGPAFLLGLWARLAESANAALVRADWESGAAVALLVLEALHPSRPWHTGVLGAALICYLLMVHQAESAIPPRLFHGQTKVLLTSLALLAMATGVAMLPSAGPGGLSAWLEDLAALSAVTAGALALPI
jgi:hypothetical protein